MSNEKYDVVIIGAGLSGIGAAVHITRACPEKTVALFESREAIGGTWDFFRYPGIRSDSDMFTLGYKFKPWMKDQSIADGALIKDYIQEASDENNITDKIQLGKRITRAAWDSAEQCWTLTVVDGKSGDVKLVQAGFVMGCTGYYNYQQGYEPELPGKSGFKGKVIHPQHWPEDLDYSGKRVVIIGSGATAVTLAPAMADAAGHVTLLQRSPSYVMNRPKVDPKQKLWKSKYSSRFYYRLMRMKNVMLSSMVYQFCRHFPDKSRKMIQAGIEKAVGPNVDMKHFSPQYSPWDERLCAVTDNDLFHKLKEGSVTIETDHIDCLTKEGILLKSGKTLDADVIITATGLNLQMLGGMEVIVDNEICDVTTKLCYRDVLMEDVPNMGFIFGYTNSSWTLKADLLMGFICRILKLMNKDNLKTVVPRNTGGDMGDLPFVEMRSGYIQRAQHIMPRSGKRAPWRLPRNYFMDYLVLKFAPLKDGRLTFFRAANVDEYVSKPSGEVLSD